MTRRLNARAPKGRVATAKGRWSGVAGSAALIVAALAHASAVPLDFIDDAYISFRYAWNLAHGHGLVFNVGQVVEGYSNLTWVLLASAMLKLGIHLESGMRAAALLCLVTTPLFVYALLRRLGMARGPAVLAGLLLISAPSWIAPMLNGLEGPLFSLLVVIVTALNWRLSLEPSRNVGMASGLAGVLLAATRPEGVLIYVAQMGLVLVVLGVGRPYIKGGPRAGIATFLVGFGAWTAWRFLTYGTLLPNAVLAKLGPRPWERFFSLSLGGGLRYSIEFVVDTFPLWLVAAAGVLWMARRVHSLSLQAAHMIAMASLPPLIGLATVLASNGDWMPYHRLLAPYLPLLVLITATLFLKAPRVGAWMLLAASFGFVSMGTLGPLRPSRLMTHEPSAFYRTWCRLGADLQAASSVPGAITVGTEVLGVLSYCAPAVRFTDFSGLTDAEIARQEPSGGVFGRKTRPARIETMGVDAVASNDLSNWKRLVDESTWFVTNLVTLSCDELLAENAYVFLARNSALASAQGISSCPKERMPPADAFRKASCLRKDWNYSFARAADCSEVQ